MDPLIKDIQIVTGFFITFSGCPYMIGKLLDLSFDPLGCSLDAVPAAFHNQVTFRDDLIKGSRKIECTDVFLAW